MADAIHQNWAQMPFDAPMSLLERRRVIGKQTMVSHVTLKQGFRVASHSHENEQVSCVLSGCLRFGLGAEGSAEYREVDVRGGEVLLLPSNLPHSATATEDSVVLDIFSPPSEKTGIDGHG